MRVRIGILGTASIAKRSIIPSLIGLQDHFELVGIASRKIETAIETAQIFKVQPYGSYDQLISKGVIDAIYIPLPNSLHYEWVRASLNAGIHVLVEKSLGINLEEVLELNQLARTNKLVLMENFQFRFHSQLEFIKNILDDNEIGSLRCFRSSFGFPPFNDSNNIRYQKHLGGGALLDAGAYPVKISQLFLGAELIVSSANLVYDKKREVDIWGGACLKQVNGDLFSQVAFGFDNYYQCNLELWGTKGRILTNRIFTAPALYEPELIIENEKGSKILKLEADNHFKKSLLHFFGLVTSKIDVNNEYEQNINQAKLLEQIRYRSNG